MRRTLARLLRRWADWLEPPALLPAMFVPPSDDELVDEWCHHDPQHKPRDIVAHLIQLDKEALAAIKAWPAHDTD